MSSFDVILWGNDNLNSLGLLRQLGKSEFKVLFLINGKKGISTKSRYCSYFKESKSYKDGLLYLLNNFKSNKRKPLLIPCGDGSAEVIDKNLNKLKELFLCPGAERQGTITAINDKNVMCEMASEFGFCIPEYKKLMPSKNLIWSRYPAIIKPTNINNGCKEFKTAIVNDEKELQNLIKKLNKNSEYQIQELIDKEADVLVYGLRLFNGEFIFAGQYVKDRWSDDGGGSHGLITSSLPKYLNLKGVSSFLEKIKYYGLFSVEYGIKGNKAYFYEINFRNDGTSHLFYQAGINLPLIFVNHSLKGIIEKFETINNDVWNINEIYDIINVFRKKISKNQYNKELKEAKVFHYYDKDDLKPYNYAKLRGVFDVPFRAFLKRYRPFLASLLNKYVYGR